MWPVTLAHHSIAVIDMLIRIVQRTHNGSVHCVSLAGLWSFLQCFCSFVLPCNGLRICVNVSACKFADFVRIFFFGRLLQRTTIRAADAINQILFGTRKKQIHNFCVCFFFLWIKYMFYIRSCNANRNEMHIGMKYVQFCCMTNVDHFMSLIGIHWQVAAIW